MDRETEDRICRIYGILSLIGIIGPACSIAAFLLFALLMGGVPVPGAGGLAIGLGFLVMVFPLIVSPLAIIAALILKFRYNIEMIWTLKTAIVFYVIVLYNSIQNRIWDQVFDLLF